MSCASLWLSLDVKSQILAFPEHLKPSGWIPTWMSCDRSQPERPSNLDLCNLLFLLFPFLRLKGIKLAWAITRWRVCLRWGKWKVNVKKHVAWLNLRRFKTMCEEWSGAGFYTGVGAIFSPALALWSCRCSSIHVTQLLSLDKLGFQPLALHISGYSEDCFTRFFVSVG